MTRADPRRTLAGWALALGALAHQAARGRVAPFDQAIAGAMGALHAPWLDALMGAVTWFGSTIWTILALLALSWWTWRRHGRTLVWIMVGAYVAGEAFKDVLRVVVSQWRPDTLAVPASMDLMTRFHLTGFPSGHAFRSAFVFGWVAHQARDLPLAGLWQGLCLAMIGVVGVSRLFLNRHWASDVLGSWLLVLVMLSMVQCWQQTVISKRSP